MTILGVFLNKEFRTGGNRRYLELMEALAFRGNSVYVIMNSSLAYGARHFTKIELSIKYKRRGFPPASFLFKRHIKKNIQKIRDSISREEKNVSGGIVDFIHVHGDTHLKAALFLRREFRAPLFYAFRANDIDRAHIMRAAGGMKAKEYIFSLLYEPVNRFREKKIARFAELITFQNAADRDRFRVRTSSPVGRTVIIPGNIGLPRCSPAWENRNTSSGVKKILYIGSLSASKGLRELLGALSLLKKKGYGFLRCFVLGRPENVEPVLRLIKELNVEEQVFIEGFKEPFSYLADCDLMVYPTLYDAFPDTVLESLHAGCPVVASAVGGIPELLLYPELLFEPKDISGIADKIEKCIGEPEFYTHIRNLCAQRAQVYRFDWAGRFEDAMKNYCREKNL
jgi:glycosyltransferase involved in cell wall biosynthesis